MMKIPIESVKENPRNPRKISKDKFEKLVASIREFPKMLDIRPLVIDKDNVVVGGNMRLKALRELGYTEVPVVMADNLSKEELKRFVIADNIPFGEWDHDVLGADYGLEELEQYGFDTKELGLDFGYDGKDDDAQEPTLSSTGDVYLLGTHKIIAGEESVILDKMISLYCQESGNYDIVKNGENITWEQ